MIPVMKSPFSKALLLVWICPWYPLGISADIPVGILLIENLGIVPDSLGVRSAPAAPSVLKTGVLAEDSVFLMLTETRLTFLVVVSVSPPFLTKRFFFGLLQSLAMCPFLSQLKQVISFLSFSPISLRFLLPLVLL